MSGQQELYDSAPCPNCKGTRFYYADGYTNCKKCGLQQEGILTQRDEDSFNTHGRTTRKARKKVGKVSKIYHGTTATELYLQAYQLILWHQCHALIHTIGLPAELEIVVKDLWALRLQLLEAETTAKPDEDTVYSSQGVSGSDKERDNEGSRVHGVRKNAMPTLVEALGLCYLGSILLRLPIGMGELHRWAVREDIPFIRAVRLVPTVMKQRLPSQYLLALDTIHPLQPDHLRKTIHNLSLFYTHHFAISFPPINAPLLLYEHIRSLAVPIHLHATTFAIAKLLALDFSLPTPGKRQHISSLPEVTLLSLLVIATKLQHPFNGPQRSSRSLIDLAALTLNWDTWITAQEARNENLTDVAHLERGAEIKLTERDAMSMASEQIDDYLDWFERMYMDEDRAAGKKGAYPKELLDMFPTGRSDGSSPRPYSYEEHVGKEDAATSKALKAVVGTMMMRPIVAEDGDGDETAGIGSFYKRYRRVEDLDGVANAFCETVAERGGMGLETLVKSVLQVENMLIDWKARRHKDENIREESEGGAEVGRERGVIEIDDTREALYSDSDNS